MRHIETVKKAFVFTDIKDFTLKNSLLTQLQIREFLNTQDELVFPIIKKYNGTLVKTIGDAYMIVFDYVVDALNASIEILNILEEYNSKVSYNLYKIELRVIVNYGELQKEETIISEDYFGDTINIASRLQYCVDENKLYTTGSVIKEIAERKLYNYVYLGRTSLRGVLYEIEVYEIIYKPDEIKLLSEGKIKRKIGEGGILLTESLKEKTNELNNTIIELSLITAIAGMVGVPYVGLFIMLPFHFMLLKKVAVKCGVKSLRKSEAKTILYTMLASLGGIVLIYSFVRCLGTTDASGFIGFVTIVLNFMLSYIIGKYLSIYFFTRSQRIENTNLELKKMFINKKIDKRHKKYRLKISN